jgi:hypothetical protein
VHDPGSQLAKGGQLLGLGRPVERCPPVGDILFDKRKVRVSPNALLSI